MNDITELVKMALNGDRAAFDSLYEQTKGGVWFTCTSLLKNEENAKDIMQDTYLAAFDNLNTLENPASFRTWLNKIAANKCKNFISAKANSTLASGSEEILENIPDDKFLPEEYVIDAEKRRIIMDIIEDALSVNQYRTIILYYFDEMTVSEIAELMDCHEKTVQYRLKTARIKIKEEITRYEEENRDKLHAIAPFVLLTQLFRAQAESVSVPAISVPTVSSAPSNALNVPSNQAAAAAKQGGKTMLNSLKAKIIAGACAAVVVGGGVTAGVIISNNSKNNTTSTPVVSTPANVSTSANDSKPANVSTPAEQSTPVASNTTSGTASATTSGAMVEGDFEYAPLNDRGKVDESAVMITKYIGSGGHVIIPSELGGKPVKSIKGDKLGAFYRCENVTEVTIPEGVLYIEISAFCKCTALEKINLPSSLVRIGSTCFEDCKSLVTVTLPENLNEIGYEAFASCDSLKTVYLNDNLHILGKRLIKYSYDAEVFYKGQSYNVDTFDELIETYFNGDLYMPGR